jgi:hypothetical protein
MMKYPAYDQVAAMLQDGEKSLRPQDKRKILTVRGLYDEKMSDAVVSMSQASNIRLPMIFHALIIASALTIFSRRLIVFIKK